MGTRVQHKADRHRPIHGGSRRPACGPCPLPQSRHPPSPQREIPVSLLSLCVLRALCESLLSLPPVLCALREKTAFLFPVNVAPDCILSLVAAGFQPAVLGGSRRPACGLCPLPTPGILRALSEKFLFLVFPSASSALSARDSCSFSYPLRPPRLCEKPVSLSPTTIMPRNG